MQYRCVALADNPADSTLAIAQPIPKKLNRLPSAGRTYKFFAEMSIASLRISMSIRSGVNRFI